MKGIFLRLAVLLTSVFFLAWLGASTYFFYVAQVRSEKEFINNQGLSPKSPLYPLEQAFDDLPKESRHITNQGLKQVAWYLPASQKSSKTAILVHGFTNDKSDMKPYAKLFHDMGYNVLMPDNVAHGQSQGKIIGYGWKDKENVIKWTESLVAENSNQEITLFGVSMGAATVMMASGEKLPEQVVNIIEDCGYTSVWDEVSYQAKSMYQLPEFPILYGVSALSKLTAGFSYGEASAVNQLAKNHLPTLFIHGDQDDFVPVSMVYENFEANRGPKELYVVNGAKHAQSFAKDPQAYRQKIEAFLKKY